MTQSTYWRRASTSAWLASGAVVLMACGAPENAAEAPAAAASPAPSAVVEATIFGRGAISTRAPEFAVTFEADGKTVYFNRASDDRQQVTLMVAEHRDGAWQDATPARFSTSYRDVDPFVAADGRLYFSSGRPVAGTEVKDFDIWFVARDGESWGEPVPLGPPVNTASTEIFATLTENGNLYFSSDRDGEMAVYRARRDGEGHAEPKRLELGAAGFGNPCVAPDESFLIMSAELPGGAGATDLYVSFQSAGAWTVPANLAVINSPYADFAPALSLDGETLFFTSERPGLVPAGTVAGRPPGDIYQVSLAGVLATVR